MGCVQEKREPIKAIRYDQKEIPQHIVTTTKVIKPDPSKDKIIDITDNPTIIKTNTET